MQYQGYNQTTYPMTPGYGQPPYVAYGPNGPIPIQTQPQPPTTVIEQPQGDNHTVEKAFCAGCVGACLAVLCCCCMAAVANEATGRGRW